MSHARPAGSQKTITLYWDVFHNHLAMCNHLSDFQGCLEALIVFCFFRRTWPSKKVRVIFLSTPVLQE